MAQHSLVASLHECQSALRRVIRATGADPSRCRVHTKKNWRTISQDGVVVVFASAPFLNTPVGHGPIRYEQRRFLPLVATTAN